MTFILDDSNALPNGNGITETETIFNPNQIEIASSYVELPPAGAPINVASVQAGKPTDPFAPIEKLRLQNKDGMESMAFNVRVKRDEGRFYEAGIVKAGYLLIENRKLNEVCEEIRSQSGMEWEHVKCFYNGDVYRNVYKTTDFNFTLEVGEIVHVIMSEINSYNSSQKCGLRIEFMVLECKNGMTSPKYGHSYTFRHSMQNVNWIAEIQAGLRALTGVMAENKLKQFGMACNKLNKPLDIVELASMRKNAIAKLPTQRFGATVDRYFEQSGSTMWDFMQAGTYTLWHKDKMTIADFNNNGQFVDGLLDYAAEVALTQ